MSRLDYGEYEGQRNAVSVRDGISQFSVSISSFDDLHPFKFSSRLYLANDTGTLKLQAEKILYMAQSDLTRIACHLRDVQFIILQFTPYVSFSNLLTHHCDSSLPSLLFFTTIFRLPSNES